MYIIFDSRSIDALKNTYVILELDTIDVGSKKITAHCALSADDVPISEIPQLQKNKSIHEALISAYKNNETQKCIELISNLKGKFGGEVDSFYEILEERIKNFQPSST